MAEKRTLNRLSDRGIRYLTAPGRYADGGNLYLHVRPGGSRQWVFFFRWQGKLKEMSLGGYPGFSLKEARGKAAAARALAKDGVDPLSARREAKIKEASAKPFGQFALELIDSIESGFKNLKHRWQWRQTLTAHCQPIWDEPIDRIDTTCVLACLGPIWETKSETASRLRGRIERVLDAAKARGLRSGENPAAWRGNLKVLLPKRKRLTRGHHPALPYVEMPLFMADLRSRDAMAALALEFCILTATRTGETLGAEWEEIDLDTGLWVIPASRMKVGKEHRIPLNKRILEILAKLAAARTGRFVFPGPRPGRPMSNMAMMMLLRRMGRGELTVHGFRSAFRDWAGNETPFAREVAEAALAHVIGDAAERAYRRGDALEKRRAMMEAWAQWCEPKAANVVPFARAGVDA